MRRAVIMAGQGSRGAIDDDARGVQAGQSGVEWSGVEWSGVEWRGGHDEGDVSHT